MRSKPFQQILDETPGEIDIFISLYADLVVRIQEILKEKNITQKELAERMDKSPSEISKWLNGEHNFTLRSLAKLSAELGEPLLEVPKKKERRVMANKSSGFSIIHSEITTKLEGGTSIALKSQGAWKTYSKNEKWKRAGETRKRKI